MEGVRVRFETSNFSQQLCHSSTQFSNLNSGEKKGGGAAVRVAVGEDLPAGLLQGEVGRAETQRERIVIEIKKFVFNKDRVN